MDIFFGLVLVGRTATSRVKDSKVTGYVVEWGEVCVCVWGGGVKG